MCVNCGSAGIGRRDLMKFGAAAAIALATEAHRLRHGRRKPRRPRFPPGSARSAQSGERTLRQPSRAVFGRPRGEQSRRRPHQAPWATIISCADSRVPPELIFGGHGVGELFVARDAGNLVGVDTLGTIEYGAAVLGSPLIVILAHTACGAVKAACDVVTKNATYPGVIGRMIAPIVPAALAVRNDSGDFTDNSAKESAKRTAAKLPGLSAIVGGLVGAGKVKIVAAIYNLETGVVTSD